MMNRVGLSSVNNISKQSVGFGHSEEEPKKTFADKTAAAAAFVQEKAAEPIVELGLIGAAGKISKDKLAPKVHKLCDTPIADISGIVGKFLAEHTNQKGIIGKTLSKIKPLSRVVSEHGVNAAEHLTNVLKNGGQTGVKLFVGLLGAIGAAKEMPRIKAAGSDFIDKLGTASVISDLTS